MIGPAHERLAPVRGADHADVLRQALPAAGWTLDQVDVVEVVEAYAVQALACLDALGLTDAGDVDPRVNAAGGALALGHPWGATAAMAIVRAAHRLQSAPPHARALVTCAVAGGMGAALLMEVTA